MIITESHTARVDYAVTDLVIKGFDGTSRSVSRIERSVTRFADGEEVESLRFYGRPVKADGTFAQNRVADWFVTSIETDAEIGPQLDALDREAEATPWRFGISS